LNEGGAINSLGILADAADLVTSPGSQGLSRDSIERHSSVLIIAGSETTATTLSAVTYYLGTHPEVMARVMAEVRNTYASDDDIGLHNDVQTPYLHAVIEETLRLFPAAPTGSARVINKDGEEVDGKFLPPGVSNVVPCDVPLHLSFSGPIVKSST
jgi:cytochrome P450